MQIVVNAGELAAALKVIHPAVAGRTVLPILTHVLLDALDDRLTLSATNLEISLRTSIHAEVSKPGRATASEAMLSEWVGLQPKTVATTLKADAKNLHLTCGRDRARLGVADAEDMPPSPNVEGQAFILAADMLARGLDLTLPSVARDDSRHVLRGLCWTFAGEALTLAGADGHRLGVASVALVEPVEEPRNLIVPRTAMLALRGLLGGAATVLVETSARLAQVAFTDGETRLCSSVIEGQFPDYQRIIPVEFKTSATVQADALARQVRSAQLAGKTAPVSFRTDPDDGTVTVWSQDPDAEHEGVIDGEVRGEALEIALNAAFTLDALEALGGERVTLGFNGASSPCLITTPEDSSGALQVVMPMHIKGAKAVAA
jgi:DNA polymerase-3 subunit beta